MSGRTRLQFVGRTSAFRDFLVWAIMCIALATSAGPVGATDLPFKTELPVFQPPPPAEFDWTGFYAGVNVGGGIDHFAFPYSIQVPWYYGYTKGSSGITASGPLGGIQAGYNYALPFFHLVAGVEIDADAAGISGQTTVNGVLFSRPPVTATFGTRLEDFGTARVRLGYAWGQFMPYLTAGLTFATTETFYSAVTPGFFATGSNTGTRAGIFPHVGVGGIGLEYAFAPNFTVRAEYLYEFINARSVIFNPAVGSTVLFNTRTMYHVARLGLNYKLDWLSPLAEPVVAKY